MRRAANYSVTFSPDLPLKEEDSYTCHHCNVVVFVKPGQKGEDIGGLCKCCMNLICAPCVDKMVCIPFEEKLRREEQRETFLARIGF